LESSREGMDVEGRVFVEMVSNYSTKDDKYIHENMGIVGVTASV
jgi:hypothetical protein